MINKITKFISEVKQELGKVSWSTRQEVIASTFVVITVTALVAVFIYVIDILLTKILTVMFKI